MPDLGMIGGFENYDFSNLRKVTFNDIDYVPGGLFYNNNTLEEIVFNGLIGHFDCSLVVNCPNLRKIVFRGRFRVRVVRGWRINIRSLIV